MSTTGDLGILSRRQDTYHGNCLLRIRNTQLTHLTPDSTFDFRGGEDTVPSVDSCYLEIYSDAKNVGFIDAISSLSKAPRTPVFFFPRLSPPVFSYPHPHLPKNPLPFSSLRQHFFSTLLPKKPPPPNIRSHHPPPHFDSTTDPSLSPFISMPPPNFSHPHSTFTLFVPTPHEILYLSPFSSRLTAYRYGDTQNKGSEKQEREMVASGLYG
jgi:hypothetical protein